MNEPTMESLTPRLVKRKNRILQSALAGLLILGMVVPAVVSAGSWVLILPPVVPRSIFPFKEVDGEAPLSQWRTYNTYSSEGKCWEAMSRETNAYNEVMLRKMEDSRVYYNHLRHMQFTGSHCVPVCPVYPQVKER